MNTHNPDPEPPGTRSPETAPTTLDRLAHWLIHQAARGAPTGLSERLEEEWLADLPSRDSGLDRLRFAVGCCWAIRVIVSDHAAAAATIAVTAPATVARVPIPYLDGDANFLPRSSLTVVAVIAFHIAIFYALLTGLGVNVTKLNPPSFQTHLVPDTRPTVPPPALPHPTITGQVLQMQPPEVPPTSDADDPVDFLPRKTDESTTPSAGSALTHEVRRIDGGPGVGFPVTDEFYPSAAKRLEEQGIATVRVCVDPSGRLTSAPVTVQSSGYTRLDEGAIQLAKAGSGHYRASTEDGRPVESCYAFRIRFQLRN